MCQSPCEGHQIAHSIIVTPRNEEYSPHLQAGKLRPRNMKRLADEQKLIQDNGSHLTLDPLFHSIGAMGHTWKAGQLFKYVLRPLKCLLIVWLVIMTSSILFYIRTTPHKINYLWLGYNWSVVFKSIITIGNEISPSGLEESLCLFLSSLQST